MYYSWIVLSYILIIRNRTYIGTILFIFSAQLMPIINVDGTEESDGIQ